MAISEIATGTGAEAPASSPMTITLTAAPAAGDLILVFVTFNNTSSGSHPVPAISGFTSIATSTASVWARLHCFGKISDGTEGTSLSLTWTGAADQACAGALVYRGVSASLPSNFDATADASSNTTVSIPALTLAGGANSVDVVGVCFGGNNDYTGLGDFSSWGDSLAEKVDTAADNAGFNFAGIGMAAVQHATASATSVTQSTSDVNGVIRIEVVASDGNAAPTKIQFVNAGAQAASNATPQTPALPTNHAAGDLLLMFCTQASSGSITFSPPAGWTSIARNANATRSMTIEVYAKIDNGSESNPSVGVSAATNGWTVQIGAWRYVDEAVIEDVADVSSDAAAAATFQPTGITTVTVNAWVISFVCSKDDNALNYNNQNGYSDRMSGASYDTTIGNGSDQAIGVADKEFSTTGAQTCPTWNESVNGNDAWVGLTLALRPHTLVWGSRPYGVVGAGLMTQLLAT